MTVQIKVIQMLNIYVKQGMTKRKGMRSFSLSFLAALVYRVCFREPGMWQNAEQRASFMHTLSLLGGEERENVCWRNYHSDQNLCQ